MLRPLSSRRTALLESPVNPANQYIEMPSTAISSRSSSARLSRGRKFLIALVTVALALVAGLLTADRAAYTEFLVGKLQTLGRRAEIGIRFLEPAASVLGLRAKGIEFRPRAIPFPLLVEQARLRLRPLSLLKGAWSTSLDGTAYSGAVNVLVEGSFDGGRIAARTTLRDVDISKHFQLAGLGITSGKLSVQDFQFVSSRDRGPEHIEGQVQLSGFSNEGGLELTLPVSGGRLPIKVPSLGKHDISFQVSFDGSELVFRELQLTGAIGKIAGELRAIAQGKNGFEPASRVPVSGRLEVSLSGHGTGLLGSWLPLLTGGRIQSSVREFSCTVAGSLARPILTCTPSPAGMR